MWEWGWVTKTCDAGGGVRLDSFYLLFMQSQVCGVSQPPLSSLSTCHSGLGLLPQQTTLKCHGCQQGRGHLCWGSSCVSVLLLPHFPGGPVPMLSHLLGEKARPDVQPKHNVPVPISLPCMMSLYSVCVCSQGMWAVSDVPRCHTSGCSQSQHWGGDTGVPIAQVSGKAQVCSVSAPTSARAALEHFGLN